MLCTSNANDLSEATRHISGSVSWRVIAKRVLCYVDIATVTATGTSATDSTIISTAGTYPTYNQYFWLNIAFGFIFEKYLQLADAKLWW